MAKFFQNEKRRKRALTALSALIAATLSLGVFAACGATEDEPEDKETAAIPTDTQLLKNGNFEWYGEMMETDRNEKRTFISTPTSWSYTSGSPSSNTRSGLVLASEWKYLATSGRPFSSIDDAVAHWNAEDATLYDRLKFYEDYKTEISELDAGSDAKKLFDEYKYTIDFEDVQYLKEQVGDTLELHDGVKSDDDGNPTETGVLMIHNERESDGIYGTAQYYTSSTTITLKAGTAAEVSVWVRTDHLEYGYKDAAFETAVRGAYVGIVNTVGSSTLDEMQIKNINTDGEWQQYSVYIRANTFASTTFRIKLGLGQGSSDDRYEAVNGYAFFDDVTCKVITAKEYENLTGDAKKYTIEDTGKDKTFNTSSKEERDKPANEKTTKFALDLLAADKLDALDIDTQKSTTDLTVEKTGVTSSWTSEDKGFGKDPENIAGIFTYNELKAEFEKSGGNGYLKPIFKNDFDGKFPFYNDGGEVDGSMPVVMLLSRGAAYTTKLVPTSNETFKLSPDSYMLVSFFVKTSEIRSGRSGAGAILIDGVNKTTISPFDSTTLDPVDIDTDDEEKKESYTDIYKGWTQCFFFVANETDEAKEFSLELTYGPTAIASSTVNSYGDGYAAFTNFETYELTKEQYGYVSTNDRAKKVSLTGETEGNSKFDDASAVFDIEKELALPLSFRGVQAGSNAIVPNEYDEDDNVTNKNPSRAALEAQGLYYGLLNSKYAKNYLANEDNKAWLEALGGNKDDANAWWSKTFGGSNGEPVARQPLVLLNTSGDTLKSYGFFADKKTLSSNSYQRISVRLKVSSGLKAYVYLTDVSDTEKGFNNGLTPKTPKYTYWYDDDGNICASDPTDKDFDEKTGILYYLEDNGLYTKAGDKSGTYYANLHNYKEKAGNLVTDDDTVAFYGKDGKYYTSESYDVEVHNLPTDIVRYKALEDLSEYESIIEIDGTKEGIANKWITVSFYVHTGNKSKDYRLEIWAGQRDYDADAGKTDGIPAGASLFVDNYQTGSVSNYATLLDEAVDKLREDNSNLDPDDEEKLKQELALYYTFSFFDSASYLRYDKAEDTDDEGNPWRDYKQSKYEEQLIYLFYNDLAGEWTGDATISYFLDYSASEVAVSRATNPTSKTDDDDEDEHDHNVNIWLAISSSLLAVVLIVVIVILLVRYLRKKFGKNGPKPKKAKKKKARPAPEAVAPAQESEPKAPEDENDPYND